MENDRDTREELARTGIVIITIPRPRGPRGGESDRSMLRTMWNRYNIDIELNPKSDYSDHLFYNQDLRSIMGHVLDYGDPMVLEVWPRFYAGGTNFKGEWEYDDGTFGETYWKNLLDDAIEVEVEE